MLKRIDNFSQFLGVEPFWVRLLIALIFLLIAVRCKFPWKPEWKSKQTKDKDGNIVTTYYHLDI